MYSQLKLERDKKRRWRVKNVRKKEGRTYIASLRYPGNLTCNLYSSASVSTAIYVFSEGGLLLKNGM